MTFAPSYGTLADRAMAASYKTLGCPSQTGIKILFKDEKPDLISSRAQKDVDSWGLFLVPAKLLRSSDKNTLFPTPITWHTRVTQGNLSSVFPSTTPDAYIYSFHADDIDQAINAVLFTPRGCLKLIQEELADLYEEALSTSQFDEVIREALTAIQTLMGKSISFPLQLPKIEQAVEKHTPGPISKRQPLPLQPPYKPDRGQVHYGRTRGVPTPVRKPGRRA